MRAQGIGDGFMLDHDPRELAEDIFDIARRASND